VLEVAHELDFSQDALGVREVVEGVWDLLDGHLLARLCVLRGSAAHNSTTVQQHNSTTAQQPTPKLTVVWTTHAKVDGGVTGVDENATPSSRSKWQLRFLPPSPPAH
jgi:hypothetical protein